MPTFAGFPKGKLRITPIPAQFFSELLPEIDHLGELKVTLYTFWKLDRMEGEVRYLSRKDFAEDERFMEGLAAHSLQARATLDDALERAVGRGSLLRVEVESEGETSAYYFLNTPRGRAAMQAVAQGSWKPSPQGGLVVTLAQERPNIFRLYEENIGPLTPLMADILRQAETDYPVEWLEDAVRLAVERNARNWRYVDTVLKSWKEKGKDEQDRRDSKEDRRRYIEGEFADYIEH
jgi:DnaD/phage-associated family protein